MPSTAPRGPPWARFLAVVAGLLAWHLAHGVADTQEAARWLATSHWSVERDRGVPEIVGYLLLGVAAVGLVVLGRSRRRPVFHAWAALYALVLLDDEMMVHERGARILLRLLDAPAEIAGVRAQDLGELTVWGGLVVLPLIAVAVLHRRGDAGARAVSRALGVLLGALVLFGVVIDQLHSMFLDGIAVVGPVTGAFEDGGELVVMSLLAAFVIGLLRDRGSDDATPVEIPEADTRVEARV